MDTAQFLARVIPPGNFITMSVNIKPGVFTNRMFPYGAFAEAAGYLRWAVGKGMDAYYALASYRVAEPTTDARGSVIYKGKREAANTMALRAFWVDLDVKRDGDKKAAGAAFDTKAEAIAWIAKFRQDVALPRPNLMVHSGYGLHVYWVLEDPMATADWQPYADALKAALASKGFKGDVGISADSARILRPPGTINAKAVPHVPVVADTKVVGGEIPNQVMLDALKPYLGQMASRSTTGVLQTQATASALGTGGGNVVSIFQGQANAGAAAQANVPSNARPRHMARIATRCEQVKRSLADHGQNDMYPLWYLGHLTLAHFCVDGSQFVHPISDGHPAYNAQAVDARVQQVASEVQTKGNGPPACSVFDRGRPGVCQSCPFFNKVRSPWDLGIEDSDLPEHFRRHAGYIEAEVWDAMAKEFVWKRMLAGDVADPRLDELATGGYALHFNYLRQGLLYPIYVQDQQVMVEPAAMARHFAPQYLLLTPGTEASMKKFVVAWIEHLRDRNQARRNATKPFGWAKENGQIIGFAVGGTLYRSDGSTSVVPVPDRRLALAYEPQGDLPTWRAAADVVMAGRPELQAVVGASFGSPLLMLTGHSGAAMSCWSDKSGVGKSSAMSIAQTVWGTDKQMMTMDDTVNTALHKLGMTRNLPALWDEARIRPGNESGFVNMIFSLVQGREKGRMRADVTLRETGEWETLMVFTSNRSLGDYIAAEGENTDAGALRLFEFQATLPGAPLSATAQSTIRKVVDNFGHAGRAYAAWLAANVAQARSLVERSTAWFSSQVGAKQEERFHIAVMATVFTGAAIAHQLGLASFDLPALRSFLLDTFDKQRTDRINNTMLRPDGSLDLDDIFGRYLAAHAGQRLVTDTFSNRGPKKVSILWQPQNGQAGPVVHASQQDSIVRFMREPFRDWCLKNRLSYTSIKQHAERQWGAIVAKRMFGGSTGWANYLWCIDVPVTASLQHVLYITAPAAAAPAPASPAPASPVPVRPNTPKI